MLISTMNVLFTKYYSCNQIHKNEMGGVRHTYGQEQRCIQGFDEKPGGKNYKWTYKLMSDLARDITLATLTSEENDGI